MIVKQKKYVSGVLIVALILGFLISPAHGTVTKHVDALTLYQDVHVNESYTTPPDTDESTDAPTLTPTPTPTSAPDSTQEPIETSTPTTEMTPEATQTPTPEVTPEPTDTLTPTPEATPEPTETPAPIPEVTPETIDTLTPTLEVTPEANEAPTSAPEVTQDATETPTPTPELTPEITETPTPTPTPDPNEMPVVTVTFIVRLVKGLSADAQQEVITRNGGTEISCVPVLRIHIIEVPESSAEEVIACYQADSQVLSIERNRVRQIEGTPSDPSYTDQWALPKIGWEEVFGNITPTGSAKVAILDTGIDARHPDLNGKVLPGYSAFDGFDAQTDPNGHGTEMAGIVAAGTDNGTGIAGVAYAGVSLLPVQVLGADGTGLDSDIINGIVWATDNGANVILMSFSNPDYSAALQDSIDYAWENGVVLVAAVGNDGTSTVTYPAGDRGVMGISATDQNDELYTGSNYGTSVFLAAPGVNILSTGLNGSYTALTGTSTSAAIVAGAAAFMKAVDPGLTNGVIVNRLALSTDVVGTQEQTGNGRINIANAINDTGTDFIQPAGAAPLGAGGPYVRPYVTAGTITSTSTGGNWNATTTWSGSVVPGSGDDVHIANGATVTVTANATCNSLTFDYGTGTGTLSINSGITLTVTTSVSSVGGTATTSSAITGLGTLTCASLTVNVSGIPGGSKGTFVTMTSTITALTISGNLNLDGTFKSLGSKYNDPIFNLGSGTVTVNGTVTEVDVNASGGTSYTLNMNTGSGNGILVLGGAPAFTTVTTTGTHTYTLSGTSTTVNYSGAAQTVYATTYTNLTLSGSGAKTTTGATVNGILSMEGTATTTGTVATYGAGATLQYKGTSAQTTGTEFPSTFGGSGGVIINNLSGVNLGGSVAITYGLTLTSGTFTVGSNTLTLNGPTIAGTPANLATTSSSSLSFGGSSASVIIPSSVTALNNLTINNSNGVTLNSSPTISGTLTLTSGALSIGANTLTLNGAISTTSGSLTGGSSSNITIGGSGASTTLPAVTLNNLTINRSNGISLGGAVTVGNTLTLTSGIVTSTSTNLLAVTNTSSGAVTGYSSSSYVNGPFQWSLASGSSYLFPVGDASNYRPFEMNSITCSSAVVRVTMSSTGASTVDGTLSSVAARNWYAQLISGSFTSATVRITESGLVSSNVVASSSAQSGNYTNKGGNSIGTTITSNAGIAYTASTYFAIGTVTPTVALSDNGTQITAASIAGGTSNLVLHKSTLAVTVANATLTGMTCTTAGTYASADITNLKVWYQTASTYNSGTATLLSTLATPGTAGAKTFPSFTSQVINSGTTGYIFITADVAPGATIGNTINLSALTTSDFTFTTATKSGSTTAGGAQTFTITIFYNKSSGASALQTLSNWGTNTDGTGTVPNNFTTNNQLFYIYNGTSTTIGAAWTVSGTNTKVVLGNASVAAITFTIPSGFAFTGTIDIAAASSGSNTLTIQNATIPTLGTLNSGSTVDYDGTAQTVTAATYGNLTLSNSSTKTMPGTSMSISGNLTMSGTATATTAADLTIGGNLVLGNGTTFTAAGYALTVTGTTTAGGGTSGNLTISSATGTKIFSGLVTVNAGGTWNNSGNSTINFRGGITNNGTFTAGSGVHTFDTNAQALTGTLSIPSVTVTGITLTNNNTLTVGTALSGTGGLTQAASSTLNIGGTSGINTLTAGNSGNTVNYAATAGGQTVVGTTYYNLTFSNTSGTDTAGGNITVNSGTLTTTAGGTLDMTSSYTLGGTLSATNNNGTIKTSVLTSTSITPLPSGKTWGGTIEYGATSGSQTIVAGTFNNLTLDNSSGINTASGNLTINGTLTTTASGTLDMGTANILSGSGTFTNNGTIKTSVPTSTSITPIPSGKTWAGTIEYGASSGAQTIVAGTYNNLTLDNTSGSNTAGGSLTINGTLTTTAGGTLDMGTAYILSGSGTFTNNGTIKTSVPTSTSTTPIPSGKTWAGTIEYGASSGAQSVVAGTFNNLTLDNTSGSNTAGGSLTINGTLTTTSGGTLDMGTAYILSGSGTFTNNGTIKTSVPTSTSSTPIPSGKTWAGTIEYGASAGAQTIVTGTYNNLTFDNTSGTNTATSNITVNGTLTTTAGGTLDMTASYTLGGTLSTISNNGTIKTAVLTATSTTPIASGKTWGGTGTVEYAVTSGAQTIVAGTYNNLTLDNSSGTNSAGGSLTINGTLTTTAGGTLDMTASYTLGGTLSSITNNGTIKTSVLTSTSTTPIAAGKTWGGTGTVEYTVTSGAQTIVGGTYNNLTLDNSSNTSTAGGNLTINGTLTTTAGGTLDMGTAYILSGSGTFTNNGTIKTSVPTSTSATPIPSGKTWAGTIEYGASSGSQTIVAGTFNNLTLDNTSGSNTAGGSLTVNGTLTTTASGTLDMGTAYILSGSGTFTNNGTIKTSVPTSTSTTPIPSGKTWAGTIEYGASSGSQTIVAGTFNNLTLDNTSGTNTAGGSLTINGTLTTTAGGTLDMGTAYILSGSGIFTNNGTIKTSVPTTTSTTPIPSGKTWSGIIEYGASSGAQTIVAGTYNNLTLDNSSGTNTAGNNLTVNGTLSFSSGTLTTSSYTVTISASGTVSRTSGYVIGNLKKYFATGATSQTFEVGSANYDPVTAAFNNITVAGYLTVLVISGQHPSIGSSVINASKDVNIYWTLTNSGITYDSYSATFNFASGDIIGGGNPSNFSIAQYNTGWTYPTIDTRTSTSTQATGITAFGDFVVGECSNPPTITLTTPASMTPQQQWTQVTATVTIASTLADIKEVQITVFYDSTKSHPTSAPTTGNVQTCAIITWTRSGGWSLDQGTGSTWALNTGGCSKPSDSLSTGDWVFSFKVGKVATYTTVTSRWDVYGSATNIVNATGTDNKYDASMAWYGEISVSTVTIDWGIVYPGSDFTTNVSTGVTLTYICNGNFNEQAITDSSWTNGSQTVTLNTSGSPGNAEFSLKANSSNTYGTAQTLNSTSSVTIGTGTQTGENGVIVSTNTLWLKVGAAILPYQYTGTINFSISPQ